MTASQKQRLSSLERDILDVANYGPPIHKGLLSDLFSDAGNGELERALRSLHDKNAIHTIHHHIASKNPLPSVAKVRISRTQKDGFYKLEPVDEYASMNFPEIVISEQKLAPFQTSEHTFFVALSRHNKGLKARVVQEVNNGDRPRIACIFNNHANRPTLSPTVPYIQRDFDISGDKEGYQNGDLVIAEITKGGRKAEIVQKIDVTKRFSYSNLSLINAGYKEPPVFSQEIHAEVDQLIAAAQESLPQQKDFTHIPFIAIDPADARDRDDAICAMPDPSPDNNGGWIIMTAIADVGSIIPPRSLTAAEALKRANSIYFADKTVRMLPDKLTKAASLSEEEQRLARITTIRLSKDNKMLNYKLEKGCIQLKKELSYPKADRLLKQAISNKEQNRSISAVQQLLLNISESAGSVQKHLFQHHENEETSNNRRAKSATYKINELFALATNSLIARYIDPPLYRTIVELSGERHDYVRADKLLSPEEAIRSGHYMGRYTREPTEHSDLGIVYTHITSPIRRIVDLVLQWHSDDKDHMPPNLDLDALAIHATQQEKLAERAGADALQRHNLVKLKNRHTKAPDKIYKATIVEVKQDHLIFQLRNHNITGAIPLQDIPDNYPAKSLNPGHEIPIKLTEIDPFTARCKASIHVRKTNHDVRKNAQTTTNQPAM